MGVFAGGWGDYGSLEGLVQVVIGFFRSPWSCQVFIVERQTIIS